MGNLIKEWVKSVLTEEVNKTVVVYAGRFQPFHKGHYATYKNLVSKFGKENVFIGTSNKSGGPKDPFNFLEKKKIMMAMFGISSDKIVQVKNPYAPTEILKGFPDDTTAFVTVVGGKDAARLGGKYFKKFHSGDGFKPAFGYKDHGYVYVSPAQKNAISGTDVRNWLSRGDESQKRAGFKKAYPKWNQEIFDMISKKLGGVNEIITNFLQNYSIIPLIESTLGGGYGADAGEPDAIFVPDNKKRILGLGKDAQKNDYWFVNGGYTQMHFPKADVMVRKSAKGTGDFYQYASRRKVFTMDDLLDIPETEDYLTADLATSPLDTTQNAPEVEITGLEDTDLKEVYRGMGYEVVEWILGKKLEILDKKQYKLLETIGKRFSNFLTEGGATGIDIKNEINVVNEELKWQASTLEMCMNDMVPLTLPIVKKLVEIRRTTAFHITDVDNLSKLVSLEGKSKSISTFNKIDAAAGAVSGKGMWTNGGILVLLSGIVLAESIHDLWSKPDKSGRRWVAPGNAIHKEFSKKNKIIDFAPKLKPLKEKWEQSESNLTNQEKQYFIKTYIDTAHKLMIDNKEYFQDKYLNSNYLYYESDWNEVILSKIKVEKIAVIRDGIQGVSPLKDYPNDVQKKYNEFKQLYNQQFADDYLKRQRNPNDNSTEIIDTIKKKYKNVEIITSKDVPSFIKKNGGYIRESINQTKNLITEGGAYGHMNHPFDNELNLTFGDLKNIITKALNGELELTREKTDGMALAISWRDDRGLIAARNKGHLANSGENAMSITDVATKFAGRGGLTDAYNFAMKDLEKAVGSLSKAQRDKIFKQGKKFMNLEVIYPTSVNVIPYGQALLVFHNTTEYDDSGVAIGAEQSDATILAGMIKQVNQHVQDKYTIQGPPVTQLPKEESLKQLQPKFLGMLQKLQSKFGLKDSDGMAEYHQAWWDDYIEKNSPEKLDKETKDGLIRRWAFFNKGFGLSNKTIKSEKVLQWALGVDKNDHQKISKDNIRPFEDIFLGVGSEVLSFMSSVLTVNPDEAIRSIKTRLDQTIKDVKTGGDPKKVAKLKMELERLEAIGGVNKIVPKEGIVFVYKGNTLKLTGLFAPINQILGLFY